MGKAVGGKLKWELCTAAVVLTRYFQELLLLITCLQTWDMKLLFINVSQVLLFFFPLSRCKGEKPISPPARHPVDDSPRQLQFPGHLTVTSPVGHANTGAKRVWF